MAKRKLNVKNGSAVPLGNNYFLMSGATHEQGGIDIGKNLEVENGEIIKLNPKSIKVLSNAPIMGDITPAEYALGGLKDGTFEDRYNKGFKYQEKFKDINGLNDDGTKANFGKVIKYINDKGKQLNRFVKGKFMDFAQNMQNSDENSNEFSPSIEGHQDFKNNKYPDPSQTAYLFNKEEHKAAMLNSGYIEGTPGDYGLVKAAVGDRNLPVYQKRKDDEYVGNLHPIANPDLFYKNNTLEHAGPYPTTLYVDDAGNVFQKGWDLHDYGEDAQGNKGIHYKSIKQYAANMLDKLGNPFVRTTGLTKLDDSDIKMMFIGDTNKNLIKDILSSNNETLLKHYNNFKNNRLKSMYKETIESEYYKHNKDYNEEKFKIFKEQYPYEKFIKELDKHYSKDELETLKIFKLGGQMKNKYKFGGKAIISSTGEKKKAYVGTTYFPKELDFSYLNTVNTSPYTKLNVKTGQISYPKIATAKVVPTVTDTNPNKINANAGDWINLGTNVLGAIGNLAIRHGYKQDPIVYPAATPISPVKLKTNYNINPQLQKLARTVNKYKDAIAKNTASSQTSLNRLRNLNLEELDRVNYLYGEKYSKEIPLINADRMNFQNVMEKNIGRQEAVDRYNIQSRTTTNNLNKMERAAALIDFAQAIPQISENFVGTIEKRNQFNKNLATIGLGYPDIDVEKLLSIIRD